MQVKINTPYGDTENIEIREVVKQETTNEPFMCCTSTAKVNEIGEKVVYEYGNREKVCLSLWMILQQHGMQKNKKE